MQYQLQITLTEEDYLAFNLFHSLESNHGKKQVNRSRNLFILIMALMAVLVAVVIDYNTITVGYVIFMGLYILLYSLLYKKRIAHRIKSQIKRMHKTGRIPYDPEVIFEFYEDKLVEITPTMRTEQSYDGIDRICVLGEEYVYLYRRCMIAYLLPLAQIRGQVPSDQFITFLLQKVSTVEYY